MELMAEAAYRLTVDFSPGNSPPTIAKAFAPSTITSGGTSTITFTLTNPNGVLLTGANFTDTYPATMVNTTGLVVGGTCANITYTAAAGGSTFDLDTADIPASESCTVTVDVTATATGVNTTSVLSTNEAPDSAAGGSDTLTVNSLPSVTKAFAPATIVVGATSTLAITIDNTQAGAIPLTGLALTDLLPADVEVAAVPSESTTCAGGTVTALPAVTSIALTGASLGAGLSCSFQADVTAPSAGAKANNIPAADLNNDQGRDAAADANDTLTVLAAADVTQIHYRWRNDDGPEVVFDIGDGADGALTPAATFNLNTNPSGARVFADASPIASMPLRRPELRSTVFLSPIR